MEMDHHSQEIAVAASKASFQREKDGKSQGTLPTAGKETEGNGGQTMEQQDEQYNHMSLNE